MAVLLFYQPNDAPWAVDPPTYRPHNEVCRTRPAPSQEGRRPARASVDYKARAVGEER
jgi:hypothetical protein